MLCVGPQLHLMLAVRVGVEGAELLLFLLQSVDVSHRRVLCHLDINEHQGPQEPPPLGR